MARTARPCIVWFRDDLRLSDHPALNAASDTGAPVICLYVFDERPPNVRPLGGASRWWLAQSLRAMQKDLAAIGSPLLLRRGSAAKIIADLARDAGAGAVFWNEIAQAPHQAIADRVAAALQDLGVAAKTFPGDLLVAPANIRNKDGRGLRVFTPFWKRVQRFGDPPKPLPAPKALSPPAGNIGDVLDDWNLEPAHPDWAGGLRNRWTPGEVSAQAAIPQRKRNWLFHEPRPPRPRGHLKAFSASAVRRDQPPSGLARHAICRRRASAACGRHRQVPQRVGLARVLPPSAVRYS